MPIPQLRTPPPNDQPAPDVPQFDRGWRDARAHDHDGQPHRLAALGRSVVHMIRRAWRTTKQWLRGKRRQRTLLRFWLPLAGIVALIGILALVVVFAWFSRDLPDPNRIADRAVAQSTRIYARDGTTLLYQIHGDEKRTVVEMDQISKNVVNATVAIEDKDFYRHQGFSFTGILRAIWRDVTTGSSQGGSTITQQFVKNAILTNEKKLTRKIRELVLAYQIERRFSKEQILKLYFNEIPYGANAYGVEAAAETYFGKPAKGLDLAESAILAALPQAPTYYSPYGNHTEQLLGRAHYILDIMVDQGYITRPEAEAAKAEDVLKNVKPKRESIIAPHFVFYVRELLSDKYGERLVERGGLKVITSLDIDKQLAAEQAIADQAQTNATRWSASNAALVAIDPKTGQVLAMVGSRDYFNQDIDGNVNVTLSLQQPGSSIKPIVYATAFSRGFTPDTILFDLRTHFKVPGGADYVPNNYDGKDHGPLPMRKTLAGSLNIPAVKTLYLAGIDRVIDQAQRMGYTTWSDRSRLGLSLVLGGAEVKPIEHVAAFGSLATDGVLHPTTPILRVEDKSGKVLEEFRDQETRVLDENVAREVSSVLSDNDARSFIFGARNRLTLPDRPVAAKTGTTQEYRDGWTVGYTAATGKDPAIVAGVWVGNNHNTPMRPGADGSVVAAPIWNAFMRKATAGTKAVAFKKPKPTPKDLKPILRGKLEGEAPILVDKITGKEIPAACADGWPDGFAVERAVKSVHTILYYVNPGDPLGPAPEHPERDPQYASWDAPIQQWAKKNGYVEQRPAVESCDLRTNAPIVVTITSPAQQTTVSSDAVDVSFAINSRRAMVGIDAAIDDQRVATLVSGATSANVPLASVANGFHRVTITARDDVGNVASSSVDLNILRNPSVPSAYFISPQPATNVAAGSDVALRVFVYDPSLPTVVQFSVVGPGGGAATSIGSATIGNDHLAGLTWRAPAAVGSYALSFSAPRASGSPLQSDALTVVVRPASS